MLDFALKYNWWTAEDQKQDLSLSARIEYVLCYGTLEELKKMKATVKKEDIHPVFTRCKNNEHIQSRFHLLSFLFFEA